MIVIDASLAVKWFRAETFSVEASTIYEDYAGDIIAPDLLAVEVISALVRGGNMVKAARAPMEAALSEFGAMLDNGSIQLERMGTKQLIDAATIALTLGHPLKDCLYLSLAMELDCDLLTCDARIAAKARDVWDRVRVLGS
jgi:predicted nucleic acid-binding protein